MTGVSGEAPCEGPHSLVIHGACALLQVPSGRVAHRVALPNPEPRVLEHDGYRWLWSHRCQSGVTYVRGRKVEELV